MLARWRSVTNPNASAANAITGQARPSAIAATRKASARGERRQRHVAQREEDDRPGQHREPDPRGEERERGSGAGRDAFAAAEAEQHRVAVPEHRHDAGDRGGQRTRPVQRGERGQRALDHVEQQRADAEAPAEVAPDIGRARVLRAQRADVGVAEDAHEPVAEGQGARQVRGRDQGDFDHGAASRARKWWRPRQK